MHLLGTRGNLAPFHSQRQKRSRIPKLDMRVPKTTDECQENVTPPWIMYTGLETRDEQTVGKTYPNQW